MTAYIQINKNRIQLQRDSNIELLRIVLMYMIVLYHFILHGCNLYAFMYNHFVPDTAKDYLYVAVLAFTSVAVNCFVFISGYYGIKFKMKGLLSLVFQGLFYSVGIYLLVIAISPIEFNPYEFVKSFFPISFTRWWFLSVYVGLYVLSPIINKGLDALSKYQTLILIIILLYLEITAPFTYMNILSDSGLTIYTLLMIYILGRFCRRYNFELKKPAFWYLFICSGLFGFMVLLTKFDYTELAWRFTWYNSLPVILGAVSLFYIFKKINIRKTAFINNMAVLVFAVYLVHEDPYVKQLLYPYLRENVFLVDNAILFLIATLATALLLFFMCIAIEKVRQLLMTPIERKIYNTKLILKLSSLVDMK